jgi:hypothetical protein
MRIRAVIIGLVVATIVIVVVTLARSIYDLGILALGVIGFVVLAVGAFVSRRWLRG